MQILRFVSSAVSEDVRMLRAECSSIGHHFRRVDVKDSQSVAEQYQECFMFFLFRYWPT